MNTVTDSVSVGESADAPLSEFAATIVEQIESGNLQLPTLPEVALKVRDVVENPDGTVSQVAEVVSQDAGLTARLLQVANSALYRGKVEITSLPMAISRLGCPFVRDLITVQVMKQMFQAANEAIDARLHGLWAHNVEVAGICRGLAGICPGTNPDEAMLAGLLHDIGALPVLFFAEQHEEILYIDGLLDQLVEELHSRIGADLLQLWNIPQVLIDAVVEHEHLSREHDGPADLVDLVQVANLQSRFATEHRHGPVNWMAVPAFQRLGFRDSAEEIVVGDVAESVDAVRILFR